MKLTTARLDEDNVVQTNFLIRTTIQIVFELQLQEKQFKPINNR